MKKTIKMTIFSNYQASHSCLLSDGFLDIYDTVMESCNHSESFKYNICNNNILIPSLYHWTLSHTDCL